MSVSPRKPGVILILLALCSLAAAYHETSSNDEWKEKVQKLRKYIKENNIQDKLDEGTGTIGADYFDLELTCKRDPPTSVHQLKPQDVNVIGAMGDSLTAANGANATTVAGILREFRGMSWSAGGEGEAESSLTFPNILRLFNPNLKGFSQGTRFGDARDWQFNVAVPGSRARDMPRQARLLLEKMQENQEVDFENDWKIVTVFIGGNDLCALNRSADAKPEKYIEFLREGLDVLHSGMKRTLVNLVNILEIHHLRDVGYGYGSTAACRWAQEAMCKYVITADEVEVETIKERNKLYQDLIDSLIGSGRYDTRDDFTVVIQPFLKDTVLPYTESGRIDATYFAPDCFHFSGKGHALGAVNLWNNMLQPVGQKSTEWSISDLQCPSVESPYIFTNLNSFPHKQPRKVSQNSKSDTPSVGEDDKPHGDCDGFQDANKTEDWIIAVMCILSCVALLQFVLLAVMLSRRQYYMNGKTALVG